KDAHRRPFSAQQVRRSIESILSPPKPAARRDATGALQREAAALRLTGPTAKPVTPRIAPDATVELDVEELEEAIQASDEEQKNQAHPGAGPKSNADDDAPTTALSNSQLTDLAPPRTAAASQVTSTQPSDKSATVASSSAREQTAPGLAPHPRIRATDAEPAAPSGYAAVLTEVRSDNPTKPAEASDVEAQSAASGRSAPNAQADGSASSAEGAGATSAAASVENGASASEQSADDGPRRTRTGTKFGLGPVRTQDIEAAAALAAQLPAAELADPAPASIERSAYPAVREAQPVPTQSMERSAYPAVRESQAAAPQPLAAGPKAPHTRPKRYTASPKSLMQSPRLLLWAAGGLVLLISAVRLAFGPAEATRSPSVVVRVPGVATELPTPKPATVELSELALIGGDIKRVKAAPLTAATRTQPAAQEPQLQAALDETNDVDGDSDGPFESTSIRTVSAGSVRGGLARASSNRQAAAESGKPEAPTSDDLKAKGRELYQARKYREAADAYQRATQHNAADAAAYAGLGGSLLATGDTRKAIAAYQRAVHLEPAVSGFQAALGRAYLKKGDRAKARAAYTKALKLDPKNQAARTGMANAKAR
ncbi:MAG TPA: tetratricopeptide repeat protein, partial [Polyangiales bacterium]|nr:tetratricopeptide repeat protein [Polyangiales bacterium]